MNAARCTSERLEDLCQTELRSTIETSAVSKHAHNTGHMPLWNDVKFIDRDPYYYTRRVIDAIHTRLHPDNINRDSGIEIPEAWMPTIKKTQQQESRTTVDRRECKSLNETARIKMYQSELLKKQLITAEHHPL